MAIHKKESEKTENIVALTIFAILILVVVGFFTNGFGLMKKEVVTSGTRISVPFDNDPVRGNLSSAPIVIVIFSDFECPFCKRGEETVQKVYDKYPGQVALVFKNFPLTRIHPNAMNAALAAECANEQDKFWEYHDFLFNHNTALSVADLKAYSIELGLDKNKFDACLDSQKYAYSIQKDMTDATSIGISATPTFFVNGIALVGAQPESEFYSVIDSELMSN